jgi:osmoprotectant transport system ATP-binding protein
VSCELSEPTQAKGSLGWGTRANGERRVAKRDTPSDTLGGLPSATDSTSDPPINAIEFRDVSYRLPNGRVLLDHINLTVRTGEVLMLLGRSGSGKTTALKLINRLLVPSSGEVLVQGRALDKWDPIRLRRAIGYAIQDVGLFPHYTVRDNVGLIPRLEKWEGQRIRARTEEVLGMVGLPAKGFAERFPNQLSGGQRQRVGLARALAAEPPILLMDEPFGALDPITRAEIQSEFQKLQQHLHKTVVFVTHDVSEALRLGDRIGLMEDGRLLGLYSKEEFLQSPDATAKKYLAIFREAQQLEG